MTKPPFIPYASRTLRAGDQGITMFFTSISGLVVEYIVAIDVTWARFPADAFALLTHPQSQSDTNNLEG